jgi:hypothetical protein
MQRDPSVCRRRHRREEALEQQFTAMLGQLHFDDEVLEWVRDALHASHAEERREHEEAIRRIEAESVASMIASPRCTPTKWTD